MVGLQAPSLSVPPQVVGIVAGFFAGAFARFVKQLYAKRTRRIKLRKAILSEVQITQEMVEDATKLDTDDIEEKELAHTQFPSRVYEAHVDDIGLLRAPEVPAVVEYYNVLSIAAEQLNPEDGERQLEQFVEQTAANLEEARTDAESVLETHNKRLGRIRYWISEHWG